MRRPHVYERSVPRPARGLPSVPLGNPQAASRHLARLIENAIREAESLGLVEVVTALEAALRAAERFGETGNDRPERP